MAMQPWRVHRCLTMQHPASRVQGTTLTPWQHRGHGPWFPKKRHSEATAQHSRCTAARAGAHVGGSALHGAQAAHGAAQGALHAAPHAGHLIQLLRDGVHLHPAQGSAWDLEPGAVPKHRFPRLNELLCVSDDPQACCRLMGHSKHRCRASPAWGSMALVELCRQMLGSACVWS